MLKSNYLKTTKNQISLSVMALMSCVIAMPAKADTAIETETAQLGKKGEIGISQAYEYAKADDGTSGGTLTQFEYAISDRAEILVEPFFYTWDHPDGEDKVSGLGDLEITPSYEFVTEDNWRPAIVAAFKLKVPTGAEEAGSTGKFDYMPYLIFGQHYAGFTFNANIGVNITTPEDSSESYGKTTTWALEAEREILPNTTMFVEGFSTEDNVKTVSTAVEYQWTKQFNTFVAAGRTEENEDIFRVGMNFEF